MNFICIFVYCLASQAPSPSCDVYVGPVTKEQTDKLIDTALHNGRSHSFCATPVEVKNSKLYLDTIKR